MLLLKIAMKKLEIEKTKPTFIISVLKVEYLPGGLSTVNKNNFHPKLNAPRKMI